MLLKLKKNGSGHCKNRHGFHSAEFTDICEWYTILGGVIKL
ncbi:hypothetical protein FHS68_002124 [Dyadobacter arcticus]|uniref:Uncharacterized protein n=1 Tax=Dyadobacter arcticus TaxID=1078754 RepID=A0ABX0UIZ0_9BACT|nr:hypothetical protein [Dyadobacter arcticus]